jgi:hypothetical protein
MCFSHTKGYMSILYMGCMKFNTNKFVEYLCVFFKKIGIFFFPTNQFAEIFLQINF